MKKPQKKVSFSRKRLVWIIVLCFALLFGGVGAWRLIVSHASLPVESSTNGTYALSYEQCNLRGRPFDGATGLCYHSCASGAGSEAFTQTYMYCTSAVSTGVTSSKCASLYRNYLSDPGGCARQWRGTYGDRFAKDLRCTNNSWTYVNASSSTGYDKCVSPTTTTTTSSGWVWPLPSTTHRGSYGWDEYISGQGYHKGIDIGNYDGSSYGKTVVAAHAGKVSSNSYYSSSCGWMILIKADGTPYWTGYQHLATKVVSEGQYVTANQKIGTLGVGTGCAGGGYYHLHFSVEKQDGLSYYSTPRTPYTTINPCSVLSQC